MSDEPNAWWPSPWFWEVVESSNRDLRTLCRTLESLPQEDLRRFQFDYEDAMSYVNPCTCQKYWPYLEECSADAATDFADWVVRQGRSFYAEVRGSPQLIGRYWEAFETCEVGSESSNLGWNVEVDRPEYRGWQTPAGIARPIHRLRFGEDL
jgi:hypothetical protein